MEFHIKEAREKAGYTQKELAEIIGVAANTFHGYESGKHDPKSDLLAKIAKACNVSVDFLLGVSEAEVMKKAPSITDEAMRLARDFDCLDSWGKKQVRSTTDIELARCQEAAHRDEKIVELYPTRRYLQSASAGTGDFGDDASYEMIDLVKRPPAGTSFIVPVNGDSMEPTYHDGDLLFVRAQNTIAVGEIGVFVIDGHLYIKEAGENCLISHNGNYDPIYPFSDRGAEVEGKVLGICTLDYLQ